MNACIRMSVVAAFAVAAAGLSTGLYAQADSKKGGAQKGAKAGASKGSAQKMSFFITSAGSGKGGDLGGLKGADARCQDLAKAAGAGNRTWRAYLSTQAAGGQKAVNARDRIGKGPWYNAKGELIAKNLDELHDSDMNKINNDTGLTEKGEKVNDGKARSRHDMLTGSDSQGHAFEMSEDMTCRNWTSSSNGSAMLGHHDRAGRPADPKRPAQSWNMAHMSAGCSQDALVKTGGAGLLYCFAAR
jgi:hypothetical protein